MSAHPFEPEDGIHELPHSIEAEQAVLGALLVNNAAFERIADVLTEGHFYDPLHGRIFSFISKVIGKGSPASPITLKPYLEHDAALAEVGGLVYLARLAAAGVASVHVLDYAKGVIDLSTRRDLIALGQDIQAIAEDSPIDLPPALQIEEAEQALYRLSQGAGADEMKPQSMETALEAAFLQASEAHSRKGEVIGIPTGLTIIDQRTGGWRGPKLIILAGRPSMGKSSLANTFVRAAAESGSLVPYFTLEMAPVDVAARFISNGLFRMGDRIEYERIQNGQLEAFEYARLRDADDLLKRLPIEIIEPPRATVASIYTASRRLHRQAQQNGQSFGPIVVDYLGLIKPTGNYRGNKVAEVTEISNDLKGMARALDTPVIALAQLSRQVEQRDNKRPMMSDLRESGAIEQDADIIMFVYRDQYYLEREEAPKTPKSGDKNIAKLAADHEAFEQRRAKAEGKAEIIIDKMRGGRRGIVTVDCRIEFDWFGNAGAMQKMLEGS